MTLRSLFVAAALAAAVPAFAAPPAAGKRPTEPFRAEHAEIKAHLVHVAAWTGALAKQKPEEQRATMKKIVGFFEEHIKPHAGWEEKVLYPAVDRRACTGKHPFTATMRYEHTVVGRMIDELSRMAAAPAPDAVAFARRTDNLLGVLEAHFGEEEEVLLPILDATMTPADFQREIGEHGAH